MNAVLAGLAGSFSLLPVAVLGSGVTHDFVGGGGSLFDVGFGDQLFERFAYIDAGTGPVSVLGETGSEHTITYTITNAVVTNAPYEGVQTTYLLTNVGSTAVSGSLIQYTDIDVGGFPDDEVNYFAGPPNGWDWIDQGDPGVYQFLVPDRTNFRAGPWPDVRDGIETHEPGYTLPTGMDCGPGDCTAAGQWTFTLGAAESVEFTSTIQGIPIPEANALLPLAAGILLYRSRRAL